MGFTLGEIAAAVGGELLAGTARARIAGVSTDTRLVRRHQIFVAIKGDRFDGHDFLAQAVTQGATAVLVSRKDVAVPLSIAVIIVEDTVKALGRLARYHRFRFRIPVIAVTGSAGKTSTKEMIAAVLGQKYRVLYNQGTENNHIGVPMTLLKMSPRHEVAVIEMGTNHPGEIAWLAEITNPTAAVFTNVGPSHLEGLGSPEGVFEEKISLLKYLSADGCIITNADDPYWNRLLKMGLPQTVLSYGIKAEADIHASAVFLDARGIHVVMASKEEFILKTFSPGAAANALAAVACGKSQGVAMPLALKALSRLRPAKGRQCLIRAGGITFVDDTYNANPVSYANAFKAIEMMKIRGRAIMAAADMLELGEHSDEWHRSVGLAAAGSRLDAFFTCGAKAKLMGDAARSGRTSLDVRHFDGQEAMIEALKVYLQRGDVFLAKGSRGMRMEKVVQELVEFVKG